MATEVTKNKKDAILLDEAEELIKNTDLSDIIDDEYDCIDKITPEELEKARKKYRKEMFLKKLDITSCELLRFIHKDYDLSDNKNELEVSKFFSSLGKDVYHQMEPEIYDNGIRLIRDEKLLRQIKDKKFQKYVSIRKNFYALKKKLEKSDASNKAYLNTEIMTITKKLDDYISSYLLNLLIMSNKELLIEFINCKLKCKK